jgi:PAS domain S-box-containing protein
MDQRALREILEGTVAETGEKFFDALVMHLARAIDVKCAWVTEWDGETRRLKALSFWVGSDYVRGFEYAVAGTPCEPVVDRKCLILVPDRVIELYAHDPSLEPLGVVSYLGVPLLDTDESLLGHLAVMDDAPMAGDERILSIFNIFAARAAAEMRRLRRDRDLRDREEKLSRLFDSAMDAIVELDGDLRVSRMNAAAERVFACAAAEALGRPFDAFLTRESHGKLVYLGEELGRRPEGRRFLAIPDGIEAVRSGGVRFAAEATLSLYDAGGRGYYALILRDVDERLDAEQRIRSLMSEADTLRAEIDALRGFDEIVGTSPALRRVLEDVDRVAGADTTVLITGETGTGKELVARAIHRRSARAGKPLVAVNCAAIPASLQESELFGHEKGAFTGAAQRREGRFKLADGGTIFLDEVGEMGPDLQAKLLRVLQEGEFEPLGASRTLRVNVRVIAATNRNLGEMAAAGAFRHDLLYRLNVFPVHMPPLRERGDDVVLLAESFARRLAARRGQQPPVLPPDGRARLLRYDWPGNVRELQNVIERSLILSTDGRRLNLDRALPETPAAAGGGPRGEALREPGAAGGRILTVTEMRDLERENIRRALEASRGKISGPGGAAELLGLNPSTLDSRMKALGIRRPSSSRDP